ncbi:MAG: NAD-dependent epimerase/dehydratase family protein [Candidatus Thorarchaeota archaeon]|jgi:nucleoside-diphosphate-sugar epimerase
MRVMIVGGTGFLGYYSALEFLNRGHKVSSVSIPDIDLGDWFPKDILVEYLDIFESSHEELVKLFKDHDVMVYAVGPDDRITPKAPAYQFFHERLVVACTKVVAAAKNAGIKRCVVLGSYFEYFDRIMPEKKLSERHPYIKCRIEQSKSVMEVGGDSMSVMVLELPYIFGAMPERIPLWKDILFERLRGMKIVFFPRGGTNMIAVENVAEAIVGAAENGRHGERYLVGDENMSWKDMIRISLDEMGLKRRKVVTIPTFFATLAGKWMKRRDSKKGKESGLDYAHFFKDIQSQKLYYDVTDTVEELRYGQGGVRESIEETVRACYTID